MSYSGSKAFKATSEGEVQGARLTALAELVRIRVGGLRILIPLFIANVHACLRVIINFRILFLSSVLTSVNYSTAQLPVNMSRKRTHAQDEVCNKFLSRGHKFYFIYIIGGKFVLCV